MLKIFRKYRVPVFFSTKSDLILRDFELIKQLSRITSVDIAVSISCFDEKNAKIIEPGASTPAKRIEALSKFSPFCRSLSVLNMPVIPYISDSYKELDEIFALSKKSKVDNLLSFPLHLRSLKVKNNFFELVRKHFPEIEHKFIALYKNTSTPDNDYTSDLHKKITSLRNKYNLFNNYLPLANEKKAVQLKLF